MSMDRQARCSECGQYLSGLPTTRMSDGPEVCAGCELSGQDWTTAETLAEVIDELKNAEWQLTDAELAGISQKVRELRETLNPDVFNYVMNHVETGWSHAAAVRKAKHSFGGGTDE